MNKNINKSIIMSFGKLAILALGVIIMPLSVYAERAGYVTAYSDNADDDAYNYYGNTGAGGRNEFNPVPKITYVTPNSAIPTGGSIPVVIVGTGFTRDSIAKWDGVYRPTTFNGSEFLNMTLNASDLAQPGNHVITVFNPAPGGGNSNGVYFTVSRALAYSAPATGAVLGASTVKKTPTVKKPAVNPCLATDTGTPAAEEVKDLTANALFGANGFFPTSLMGWLLLATLILLIVILVRKFLGLESKYHSTPMKHA